MKTLFIFTAFLFSVTFTMFAQERVEIQGQITVTENANAEGITVFNESTNKGEVTDAYGKFNISVALNERLAFSSIQFREFIVIIDEGVIKNKKLNVYLQEGINQLGEVVIRPYDLSGNVAVAVSYIETDAGAVFNANSLNLVQGYDYTFTDTNQSRVQNASQKSLYLENQLNIKNIIKLFFKKDKDDQEPETAIFEADVNVRKSYNDTFFTEQLGIAPKDINSFIFYAQDIGLTKDMLNKGQELELIEFLIDASKTFKTTSEDK